MNCQEWINAIKDGDIANLIGKTQQDAEAWCNNLRSKHNCLILKQNEQIPTNIKIKTGVFWVDDDGIIIKARYIV